MVCTFFGHRNTPKEIEPTLRSTLIDLIENRNVDLFYVGNNGIFDNMVHRQLEDLSKAYSIKYYFVLAYMPVPKKTNDIFNDHTIIPEGIETIPKCFLTNIFKSGDLILPFKAE